jgi:hypothetical protein
VKQLGLRQNSPEWHAARMRMPTASNFDKIIQPGGARSASWTRYIYEIIFQRVYKVYAASFESPKMTRGKNLEEDALAKCCTLLGCGAVPGGFIVRDDEKAGCSPDGIVAGLGTAREAIEIKCPDPWRHMMYSVEGPLKDYKAQLQGIMLIGEFEHIWFFSYYPAMPCVAHKIERDEDYIKVLAKLLDQFVIELDAKEKKLRALGNFGPLNADNSVPV